jgi:putative solute:sodium symporter small subunit
LPVSPPPLTEAQRQPRHWRRVQRWTALCLVFWALLTFTVSWNARTWRFEFFGWPFGFWWAAQGAMLVFLALVALYAWVMHRIDVEHQLDEED